MDDASSQRLKLRKNLLTLLSSSTSPVVADLEVDSENERELRESAALLRQSSLLRSCTHALITREVMFTSAEAGVSSSWRIGVVGVGPSNIFLALLTAMSLPLVRIIITFSLHTYLPIPEPSHTLCCLFAPKRSRCVMRSGLS